MRQLLDYIDQQARHGSQFLYEQTVDLNNKSLHTRFIFPRLQTQVQDFHQRDTKNRWLILTGLRGVGKTTIMAQLYVWLEENLPRQSYNLIYISLDEIHHRLQSDLSQFLDAYEMSLGCKFYQLQKPTFIFIDEIQIESNAFNLLKTVYDKSPLVFFICTGSSATNLRIGADISGRRAIVYKLYPMSFTEYQMLDQNVSVDLSLKEDLTQTIYYSSSAEEVYKGLRNLNRRVIKAWGSNGYDYQKIDAYMKQGSLPFMLSSPDELSVRNIVQKVILEDLVDSKYNFTLTSVRKMIRLLHILASVTETPSLATLTKALAVSQSHLLLMLEALTEAELLIKVPAYGRRSSYNSGRPAKYYFVSPSLRLAMNDQYGSQATVLTRRGALLEDLAVIHFHREFIQDSLLQLQFWQTDKVVNCDFLLNFTNDRLTVEFGWGNKQLNQAVATMRRIKARYGIIFSEADLNVSIIHNIVAIPLKYFFLI